MLRIHPIDYILQGDHLSTTEHPIPGVQLSMATIVKVDLLKTFLIQLSDLCCVFDLR